MKLKRIVTIQDISCFGKCSLTVALPLISAMGIETCVIPTAVLSTHTGDFKGYTYHDLTNDIPGIAQHWKSIDLQFDSIYTGYLGSFEQLDIVSDFFDKFKSENTQIFVDPVMGDRGKLYAGFTPDFAKEMAKLCSKADIIVPNLTEAAFLLGEPYQQNYDEKYIKELLKRLTGLGCRAAVLTGIIFSPEKQGAVAYDSQRDEYYSSFGENVNQFFHGTGDTFSSVFFGALTKGFDIQQALDLAVDFTVECIRCTADDSQEHWYGVKFEQCIPHLVEQIKQISPFAQ